MDIHHIIADGVSVQLLKNDLFALYNRAELPGLTLQYKDFSQWQNSRFAAGALTKQEAYWSRLFSDIHDIEKAALPMDMPRPETLNYRGAVYSFRLNPEQTAAFSQLGEQAGVTLFMNVAALVNVLLFKYTGLSDIILGTGTAGRSHADLQSMVGMFVNVLPLRNRLNEDLQYDQLLDRVKMTALDAFENQEIPFETLVDLLSLPIASARNPLFDIVVNVDGFTESGVKIDGVAHTPYDIDYSSAKFDMTLLADGSGEDMRFILEYSTELFKPATVEDIGTHLTEIVQQITTNKSIKLKDIKLSHKVESLNTDMPEIDFGF